MTIILRTFIAYSLILLLAQSCGLNDDKDPIPAYIALSNPTVINREGIEDTHKITEYWVFADGQILGIFPLGSKVPIIPNGNDMEITILAGIRQNGILDTPIFYPFYKSLDFTVNLEPNSTYEYNVIFNYVESAKIPINESFENGNNFNFDIDNNPNTNIIVTDQFSSIGNKCGVVEFGSSINVMSIGSDRSILPSENALGASYIEIDYRGEGEIAIGMIKKQNLQFVPSYYIFAPARATWNKIYVDVTAYVAQKDFTDYKIGIGFTKTSVSNNSKLYIDNVKHIHF